MKVLHAENESSNCSKCGRAHSYVQWWPDVRWLHKCVLWRDVSASLGQGFQNGVHLLGYCRQRKLELILRREAESQPWIYTQTVNVLQRLLIPWCGPGQASGLWCAPAWLQCRSPSPLTATTGPTASLPQLDSAYSKVQLNTGLHKLRSLRWVACVEWLTLCHSIQNHINEDVRASSASAITVGAREAQLSENVRIHPLCPFLGRLCFTCSERWWGRIGLCSIYSPSWKQERVTAERRENRTWLHYSHYTLAHELGNRSLH